MTFKPGQSGNPSGKPKVFSLQDLKNAMEKVAAIKKQTLLERAVEMAYKEPSVMIALLKKIIPDQVEGNITGAFSGFKFTQS